MNETTVPIAHDCFNESIRKESNVRLKEEWEKCVTENVDTFMDTTMSTIYIGNSRWAKRRQEQVVAFSSNTMHRTGSSTAISMPSSPSVMVPSTNNDDDGDLSVPNSFSNASLSWDQLRRQARQVENEIELKLATLSKLGASVSSPPSTSPDAIAMNSMGKPSQELETEELLRKVSNQLIWITYVSYTRTVTIHHHIHGSSIGST